MSDRYITDIAGAVTDGDAIDWSAVRAALPGPGTHDVVTELEALSGFQTVEAPMPAAADRRLPVALEFARALAICAAFFGS